MKVNIQILACALFCASACSGLFEGKPGGEEGRVELSLHCVGSVEQTKSALLEGSENVFSGASAYVYYADTKLIDSVQDLSGPDAVITVPTGRAVEVHILGNLWAVHEGSSSKVNLLQAYGVNFPSDLDALKAFEYRLDGGSISPGYRRESLSDVKLWGIPFSGSTGKITVNSSRDLRVDCRRLFTKISLTVDHGGLDGGLNPDYFKNVKLHLRQANGRLLPFGEQPMKAISSEDVIEGDYDPDMVNGSSLCFDFYVPENMQGNLLAGNDDSSLKCREEVVRKYGEGLAGLLTYIEFTGEVNADAGGFGGQVTYRFYPGTDALANFDLERNCRYDIRLGFKVNSLFHPNWQVNASLSDSRSIGICADAGLSRTLPEGQMVAVRPGRPGQVYVCVNAGASGKRTPDGLSDAGYSPQHLGDCRFSTDFLKADGTVTSTALEVLGIKPSYDASAGKLLFSVADVSKFRTGKEVPLQLKLEPSGQSISLLIKTFEDLSIVFDKPLDSDFYPGMARTARIKGYTDALKVRCTDAHMLKYEAVSGIGSNLEADYDSNPLADGDSYSVYNYYYCNDASYQIQFQPLDTFNDGGEVSIPFKNTMPEIKVCTRIQSSSDFPDFSFKLSGTPSVYLDISGEPWISPIWLELRNKKSGELLDYKDFDPTVFTHVYTPSLTVSGDLVPVEKDGDTLYEGSEDAYVGLRRRGSLVNGFPSYEVFRRRIGDLWDERGTQVRRLRENSICVMPTVSSYYGSDRMFWRRAGYLDIYLRPLMSIDTRLNFKSRYDDYTLWESENLDEEYRNCANNSVEDSDVGKVRFNVRNPDMLELYAKPLAHSSYGCTEGASESFLLTAELADGNDGKVGYYKPLSLKFSDDGSTRHSAGPHDIIVKVTNIHSGESVEARLNENPVYVYVHFIVGIDLFSSFQAGNDWQLTICSKIISPIERTSFGDNRLNNELSKQVYAYAPVTSSAVLNLNGTNYEVRDNSSMEARVLSFRDDGPLASSGYPLRSYTVKGNGDGNLDNFFGSIKNDGSTGQYFQTLAMALNRTNLKLGFANPARWEYGDNDAPKSVSVLDYTGFGDLRSDPENAKIGYYVFHLLGDLSRESNHWIPYFEWLY